jgi:GxxExxY protein
VYNKLGFGFLESVYRNGLAYELSRADITFEREVPIVVWYEDVKLGHFRADFLIERKVIVEVKASLALVDADRKQLLNYLRGSKIELGLLLHFGSEPHIVRLAYGNSNKPTL